MHDLKRESALLHLGGRPNSNSVTPTSFTAWGDSRCSCRFSQRMCITVLPAVDLPIPRSNRNEARNPRSAATASEATAAKEALGSANTELGACSRLASRESPLLPRRLGAKQDAGGDRAGNRSILTATTMSACRDEGSHAFDQIHQRIRRRGLVVSPPLAVAGSICRAGPRHTSAWRRGATTPRWIETAPERPRLSALNNPEEFSVSQSAADGRSSVLLKQRSEFKTLSTYWNSPLSPGTLSFQDWNLMATGRRGRTLEVTGNRRCGTVAAIRVARSASAIRTQRPPYAGMSPLDIHCIPPACACRSAAFLR